MSRADTHPPGDTHTEFTEIPFFGSLFLSLSRMFPRGAALFYQVNLFCLLNLQLLCFISCMAVDFPFCHASKLGCHLFCCFFFIYKQASNSINAATNAV